MKLEFTLNLSDFKAARKLHTRQKAIRVVWIYLWPLLTLICMAGVILLSGSPHTELFTQCFAIGVGSLWLTIGLPISRSASVRKSYKRLFPPGSQDRTSLIEFCDDYILRKLSGVSEFKVMWAGVAGFAQDEKVTLIYTNKDCFLVVPTQAMNSAQRAELNDLVARHVTRKTS